MSRKRPAIKQGLCQKRVSFFSLSEFGPGGSWECKGGGGEVVYLYRFSVNNQYGWFFPIWMSRGGGGSHVFQFVRKLTDFDLKFYGFWLVSTWLDMFRQFRTWLDKLGYAYKAKYPIKRKIKKNSIKKNEKKQDSSGSVGNDLSCSMLLPPLRLFVLVIVVYLWHVQLFASSQSQSQVASHRYYALRHTHTHTHTPMHHARSSAVISARTNTKRDGGRKRSQKGATTVTYRLPRSTAPHANPMLSLSLSLSLTRKCQAIPLEV